MTSIKWPEYDQAVFGRLLFCEKFSRGAPYFVALSSDGTVSVLGEGGNHVAEHNNLEEYMEEVKRWVTDGKVVLVPFEEEPFEGNV